MPPARRANTPRAIRRAEKRLEQSTPRPALRLASRARQVAWWITLAVFVVSTGAWLEHRVTWYLAVDQFGYLTFAHDLLAGRIFHESPTLTALEKILPPHTDVMAQTYVYDHGRVYCRYSPGWPMLLAPWVGILGDDAAHYLNLTLFLFLIVLMVAFQRRLFRGRWRALVGVALFLLFPTQAHLWSLTPTRDLAHHVFAFLGLYLLLPGGGRRLGALRTLGAATALGFSITIRPDGVVYLLPAAFLVILRLWRERGSLVTWTGVAVDGALGLLIGLAPFLYYNWLVTGNALRPTQGMELPLFPPTVSRPVTPSPPAAPPGRVGYPSPGWHGGTLEQVQGGGLQIANLERTLPGNLRAILQSHGHVLVGVAIWGLLLSVLQRRVLLATALPYVVAALFLYSCWPRPDPRYLFGVFLFLPLLIVEGTFGTLDLVRRLTRVGRDGVARGIASLAALALVVGIAFAPPTLGSTYLPQTVTVMVVLGALGAGTAAIWPERRVAGAFAMLLGLALVGVATYRSYLGLATRATFQRPQMMRARDTFRRAVEPNSIVITTEDVGRPAENIEYYSGVARAIYLTDLKRWRRKVSDVAWRGIETKQRIYLLLAATDPERAKILQDLKPFTIQTVDIPPPRAIEYFVAAPFHRGLHMKLDRISLPELEKRLFP